MIFTSNAHRTYIHTYIQAYILAGSQTPDLAVKGDNGTRYPVSGNPQRHDFLCHSAAHHAKPWPGNRPACICIHTYIMLIRDREERGKSCLYVLAASLAALDGTVHTPD